MTHSSNILTTKASKRNTLHQAPPNIFSKNTLHQAQPKICSRKNTFIYIKHNQSLFKEYITSSTTKNLFKEEYMTSSTTKNFSKKNTLHQAQPKSFQRIHCMIKHNRKPFTKEYSTSSRLGMLNDCDA